MGQGIGADQLADDVVVVRRKIKEFTDDQIKAWPTTLVEVFPAPGVGKRIMILGGQYETNFVAPYSNISDNGQLRLLYGNAGAGIAGIVLNDSGSPFTTALNSFLTHLSGSVWSILPLADTSDFSLLGYGIMSSQQSATAARNAPISIGAINLIDGDPSNYEGGDPANTLTMDVLYAVL